MTILLVSMTPEKRKVTINAGTKIFKPYEASENVKFKGGVQIWAFCCSVQTNMLFSDWDVMNYFFNMNEMIMGIQKAGHLWM